jgi:hypothetical protein
VSGDFIPQQLANVLVEENIAGLTESDESDDEFDNVLYSLIDGEKENTSRSIFFETSNVSPVEQHFPLILL